MFVTAFRLSYDDYRFPHSPDFREEYFKEREKAEKRKAELREKDYISGLEIEITEVVESALDKASK